jgi:hypothetical protein
MQLSRAAACRERYGSTVLALAVKNTRVPERAAIWLRGMSYKCRYTALIGAGRGGATPANTRARMRA